MPLLEVDRVSKGFGGVLAVSGVSFTVAAGELVGIMGPNGSGKTTLFNVIAGALAPDAGRVRLHGRDIAGLAPHRICARGIARTFQLVRPFAGLTALDNVLVGRLYGRAKGGRAAAVAEAERLLALVGLDGRATTPAARLTLIDRKRLQLARALATSPAAGAGEIVALLGPNGAGKTTLLTTIAGLLRPRAGSIRGQGEDLTAVRPHLVVERGLALVPEGRRLFGSMTVEENLELGAFAARARHELAAGLERV